MNKICDRLFWIFLLLPVFASSQQKPRDSIFLKTADSEDSILVKIPRPDHPIERATVRQFSQLEDANSIINGIDLYLNQIVDTSKITNELKDLESTVGLAKYSLSSSDHHYVYRLLKGNSIVLGEVSEKLHFLEKTVKELSLRIRINDSLFNSYLHDSSLFVLPKDAETRGTYVIQFQDLYSRMNKVDAANNELGMQFSHVLVRIIKNMAEVEDLRRYVNYQLHEFNSKLFEKDGPPLLAASSAQYKFSFAEVTKMSLVASYRVFVFYVGSNSLALFGSLILLVIIGLWAQYVRKQFALDPDLVKTFDKIEFVNAFFLPSVLIIWLTLLPFFFPNMPVAMYVNITLIMALVVTFVFWKIWPLEKWLYWIAFFILFRGIAWFNVYLFTTPLERWLFFLLEISFIIWCIAVLRYRSKNFVSRKDLFMLSPRLSAAICYLSILMQVLGVVANLSGHYGLAKIMGSAGVNGLFIAITYSLFVNIVLELISVQMEVFKKDKDTEINNTIKQIQGIFRTTLIAFAVFGWLVVLSRTMNFYDFVYDSASGFLNTPRQVGKIVFTFGSVAIFFIIIWIATILSMIISFFVDTGSIQVQKRNRFANFKLLIKLGIITCGVFLAFAASGIPIDKLTIVFGALSVGIGFGLQNLANNIVSGIVISFERPIRLGDTIEINAQVGIVKEIGVRACKLYTDDGLDLIIPNGEILSKNITNWTLSSPSRRIEFRLSVELATDTNLAKSVIEKIMSEQKLIMKIPKPRVLMSSIENGAILYTCNFWCANVREGAMIKSAVLESITREFSEKGYKVR